MILEEENENKTDKVTESVTESCDMESHFNRWGAEWGRSDFQYRWSGIGWTFDIVLEEDEIKLDGQ